MGQGMKDDIQRIAKHFSIPGQFVAAGPYGHGHINDTYAAVFLVDRRESRFILQRINDAVFKDPESLMDNVQRVTTHQQSILHDQGVAHPERRALCLVPERDGRAFFRDDDSSVWRSYVFIEGARTCEKIESPQQAYQAAHAFGEFQRQLLDLPGPRLHEVIPDFHNSPKRFDDFRAALDADPLNRAAEVSREIEFALRRESLCDALLEHHRHGAMPERVTHNDTKLNNVMLDSETDEAVCVIDLDTVMPGLALYDFGDMVRTATSPVEEDEQDLRKVHFQPEMFEALARGYLDAAGGFLTDQEKVSLLLGGKLMTFECGIRFLADHLMGDVYFKIHREGHNLNRCRTQFKLIESIEAQEPAMDKLVARLLRTEP